MDRQIAMDSKQLSKDIDEMEKELRAVRICIENAYSAVYELDQMWDGAANIAFQQSFNQDKARLYAICDYLDAFIQTLKNSDHEFDKCEIDVMSLVEGIRI